MATEIEADEKVTHVQRALHHEQLTRSTFRGYTLMAGPLLVFDLDGTLVDTAPDLLIALNRVLTEAGYAAAPHEQVRGMIGYGAPRMIQQALAMQGTAVSPDRLQALCRKFLTEYERHICDLSRPYPGVISALDRFSAAGWDLAICTNKRERLSRLLLRALHLDSRFVTITGGDTFAEAKPHPGHLIATVARAGHQRHEAVMIGDGQTDIAAARAAAVPVIGVTFGYSPVAMHELEPDMLLNCFDTLQVGATARLLAESLTEEEGE